MVENIKARVLSIVERSIASGMHGQTGEVAHASIKDLNLIEDLGMDSVQVLSLLMSLEEEFSFELDEADVDLEKLMHVQSLIDFVCEEAISKRTDESVAHPAST